MPANKLFALSISHAVTRRLGFQQQLCTFYIAAGIAVDNHMTHWLSALEPFESTLKQSKSGQSMSLLVCMCMCCLQPAYLVQVDAFAKGNASPGRCRLGAPQDCQQLVMPVLLDIMAASILRLMASPVRCHPDLQAAYSLFSMVELLRTMQRLL